MDRPHKDIASIKAARSTGENPEPLTFCGSMAGTAIELGDIVGPSWTDGPLDAELGIADRGKNGPVYWVDGDFTEEEEA